MSAPPRATTRPAKQDKERRRELRRRLEQAGVPKATIDRRVDELRRRQEAARRLGILTSDLDAVHSQTWSDLRLDDTSYKPAVIDPLERGAARVTPSTARAARRRKATTKHEYDSQERTA